MLDNIYIEPKKEDYREICKRPKKDQKDLNDTISNIFGSVKEDGDKALLAFTAQFDNVELDEIEVSKSEIDSALKAIPESLKRAINIAKDNIEKFHQAQVNTNYLIETMEGVTCMQRSVGIEKIGIYIPGGTAPLFSTVLMLAVPAQIAGCKDIVLCSPPNSSGQIHPAIIYTAKICGITKIYKIGGAQAIAAMTFGTETIPSVYKVFGPGNQYVTAAKQYAQNYGVGMDLPAGPSELLIYADNTCIPQFVAADLLSQAEHGIDSQVMIVADSTQVIEDVNRQLSIQIKELPRKEIAESALQNSKAICISDSDTAFDLINEYGPEHLIIASDAYRQFIGKVSNAGSVFLGNYSPESAGDYASGTNHTLPTDGWSKSYSGVNVDSFCKKITFQEISKTGIQNLGDAIVEMANNELLQGHANAVSLRLDAIKKEEV